MIVYLASKKLQYKWKLKTGRLKKLFANLKRGFELRYIRWKNSSHKHHMMIFKLAENSDQFTKDCPAVCTVAV